MIVLLAYSICPLMDKIRGLCKLPDGRDWLWGKFQSCSGGQGHASVNL